MKLHLITLKESILNYQAKKRARIHSRNDRVNFNAFIHLSELLNYKDQMTVYKFCNPSTSKAKMSLDDFEFILLETLDIKPAEDFLQEIREKIEVRKDELKNQFQQELELI
jgi:hypothetical protein